MRRRRTLGMSWAHGAPTAAVFALCEPGKLSAVCVGGRGNNGLCGATTYVPEGGRDLVEECSARGRDGRLRPCWSTLQIKALWPVRCCRSSRSLLQYRLCIAASMDELTKQHCYGKLHNTGEFLKPASWDLDRGDVHPAANSSTPQ